MLGEYGANKDMYDGGEMPQNRINNRNKCNRRVGFGARASTLVHVDVSVITWTAHELEDDLVTSLRLRAGV